MKPRRAIPLATRYAVLCNQADPEIVEKINRAGGVLKLRYSKVLAVAKCRMTGERLIERGCEFDHIRCIEFDGSNDVENIQVLTPAAHRRKTASDMAMITKANRQGLRKGQQLSLIHI
jgi:hypothetical protein